MTSCGGAPASRHFSHMSFMTGFTPPTLRATSIALLIAARDLTKPLN